MGDSKKAIVVGAGIAGIATAIRLRHEGFDVTVCEANDYPGGKLTAFEQDGYRFDAGPSLFTLPYLVDELFELCGENPRDHFNYHRKDVACHYFWEDGTFLPAWADRQKFASEVEERIGVPAARIATHLEHSALLWERTSSLFMEKSLHRWSTYFSKNTLKAFTAIHKLNLLTTMHGANERVLKEPKMTQLFDRFATYNGSSPYLAPGVMNIIPHLEHQLGTYYPTGGMHEITMSLVRLAERIGVEFKYETRVERIIVDRKQVHGVYITSAREGQEETVAQEDELQKAKDKYLRLFAEFENYKRRTARERIDLIGRSTEELMTALLPVLDDFDRAMKSMQEANEVAGLMEGVELIHNKLRKTLEQKGLQEMESTVGQPLDTDFHEAITQIPAPEDDLKGKVVDEVEKGYLLNDRVIRYAKVVVGQ